jgi:tetratricopeptide (TPR) repeat protein
MSQPTEYQASFFDKHGPVASTYLAAGGFGLMAFVFTFMVTSRHGAGLRSLALSILAGVLTGGSGLAVGHFASRVASRFVYGGSTTPPTPQYSYQDALILQGRLDEALESFEALIAEQPHASDVRFRAAELYVKDEGSLNRAADLFREVQRIPNLSAGEDVYATNRLVDLLIGPLNDPPRALIELRRLIDRRSGTQAAERARETLAVLKARYVALPE